MSCFLFSLVQVGEEEDDDSEPPSDDEGEQNHMSEKIGRAEDCLTCAQEIMKHDECAATLRTTPGPSGGDQVADQAELQLDEVDVADAGLPEKSESPRCLRTILDAARRQEPSAFYPSPDAAGSKGCLRRLAALLAPIKSFASMVRASEKVLSATQIKRHCQSGPLSPWNAVQHALAEGRKNLLDTAERNSRAAGWIMSQEKLAREVSSQASDGLLRPCTLFRPCTEETFQVVLYKQQATASTYAAFHI